MTQLSAPMAAALERLAPLLFVAVEVQTGGAPLRLLDGSSEVTFAGRTFRGEDPDYGALALLEPIIDGVGDEAPSVRLTVNPPDAAAAARLAGASMQGRPMLLWIGVINPMTGAVDGDPFLAFAGEVDHPILRVGEGTRSVTLECVSIWERFFEDFEGVRLSNAFHQSVWPGELGLEFVTDVKRSLPWGSDAPRPDVVRDATSQTANLR